TSLFFQAEDGIRDFHVTGVQTCALPIYAKTQQKEYMSEIIKFDQDRLNKVTSILVSQSRPADENSPYFELARKYNIKVDFRAFRSEERRVGKACRARGVW